MFGQQGGPPVGQLDRKEKAATRQKSPSVNSASGANRETDADESAAEHFG
jgi:hypothetical protein